MNATKKRQIQFYILRLLILLVILLVYTVLHEGGHALVAILAGAPVREFNINFFNISAHVGLTSDVKPSWLPPFDIAGIGIPLLVWLVLVLATSKNTSWILRIVKFFSSVIVLFSLLPWIVIPFLIMAHNLPNDDSTSFIIHSGIYPPLVAIGALLIFSGGWLLYWEKTGGLKREIEYLLKGDRKV